jgi:hypothetical protein
MTLVDAREIKPKARILIRQARNNRLKQSAAASEEHHRQPPNFHRSEGTWNTGDDESRIRR